MNRDLQIELHGCEARVDQLHLQAGQFEGVHGRIEPVEGDLEEGAGSAFPVERLDDMLERDVPMLVSRQCRSTHLSQQLGYGGIGRQVDAQCQHVGEKADQRFMLGMGPVVYVGADDQVVLSRQACEQCSPAGQERHEQRGAVTFAQRPEFGAEPGIQFELHACAHMIVNRRTGPVGAQLQPFGSS